MFRSRFEETKYVKKKKVNVTFLGRFFIKCKKSKCN